MLDIRKGVCPLCRHNKIITGPAPDRSGEYHDPRQASAAVSHRNQEFLWWGMKDEVSVGLLQIFVCRDCGFTQHFTEEPASIPIGEEHLTRIIEGPKSKAPFR